MSEIRSLSSQFNGDELVRIEKLIQLAKELRFAASPNASGYYFYELANTLNAGLLLASLSLAVNTYELVVRELASAGTAHLNMPVSILDCPFSHQEDLEMDKSIKFGQLLGRLKVRLDDSVREKATNLYTSVRTPLSHGLVSRLLNGEKEKDQTMAYMFGPKAEFKNVTVSIREMEDFAEQDAITLLEEMFEIFLVLLKTPSRGVTD